MSGAPPALLSPVRSHTAFEEALERLGTAIKLGLLEPGARLPPERELCDLLGIARSTLRQALTALVQSGHLHAVRGRGGGTFVAERLPPVEPPTPELLAGWREAWDTRLAVELGVAVLATERITEPALAELAAQVRLMDAQVEAFEAYRRTDVRFHVSLAEAAGSARLLASMTEAQGAMTDLIHHIAHPREVLVRSNAQHAALVRCLERRDAGAVARVVTDHVRGTEHVLAGLLPPPGPPAP